MASSSARDARPPTGELREPSTARPHEAAPVEYDARAKAPHLGGVFEEGVSEEGDASWMNHADRRLVDGSVREKGYFVLLGSDTGDGIHRDGLSACLGPTTCPLKSSD